MSKKVMLNSQWCLVIWLGLLCVCCYQAWAAQGGIIIEKPAKAAGVPATPETNFDTGPCTGNILNIHYYPGILDYSKGLYGSARSQLDYVLARPYYVTMNPRHKELLSHGHYVRGLIYLYHASGPGRFIRAKADFEQAIRWSPQNHVVYFELSRLLVMADLKEQAGKVLHQLLETRPPEEVVQKARGALNTLHVAKSK